MFKQGVNFYLWPIVSSTTYFVFGRIVLLFSLTGGNLTDSYFSDIGFSNSGNFAGGIALDSINVLQSQSIKTEIGVIFNRVS